MKSSVSMSNINRFSETLKDLKNKFTNTTEEVDKNSSNIDKIDIKTEVGGSSIQEMNTIKEVEAIMDNNKKKEIDTLKDMNIMENIITKTDSEEVDVNIDSILARSSIQPKQLRQPPLINFVTFNRMGVTIKNLKNILDTDEDFELHLVDCNSKDNTWDFIQSLEDERIKSKTRFTTNLGPIYAANYNLAKVKPNQYFITIDSDVFIQTKNWISKFMDVFEAFPEVGLLGVMRDNPYPRYMPPIIPRVKGDISYLELKNAELGKDMDFIPGQLQCLRPELIEVIGYWSEENGYGDAELSPRILHHTSFTAGFLTTVEIDMTQTIPCNECQGREFCKLSKSITPCYALSKSSNKNESFAKKFKWKYFETFKEMEEGKRTAYCASVHDPESMKNYYYNNVWAAENFDHYIKYSN